MGLVPASLDSAFDEVEAQKNEGPGGLPPEGEYEGVILSAEVGESVKSWIDAELKLKLQVDEGQYSGKVTFADIELAPCTDREGNPSKGKLGFVKGQLAALGYTGKLSEVEYNLNSFIGARVKFRQKVDTHLDDAGNVVPYASGKMPKLNPHTNKPYEDREVYLNELLQPGFGATAAAPQAPSEPTVY